MLFVAVSLLRVCSRQRLNVSLIVHRSVSLQRCINTYLRLQCGCCAHVSVHQGWQSVYVKAVNVYALCQCQTASPSLFLMAHYFSLEADVAEVEAETSGTLQAADHFLNNKETVQNLKYNPINKCDSIHRETFLNVWLLMISNQQWRLNFKFCIIFENFG